MIKMEMNNAKRQAISLGRALLIKVYANNNLIHTAYGGLTITEVGDKLKVNFGKIHSFVVENNLKITKVDVVSYDTNELGDIIFSSTLNIDVVAPDIIYINDLSFVLREEA